MHASKIISILPLLAAAVTAAPTLGSWDDCNRRDDGYRDQYQPDRLTKIQISRPSDPSKGHRGHDKCHCKDDDHKSYNDCHHRKGDSNYDDHKSYDDCHHRKDDDDRRPYGDHNSYDNKDCYGGHGRGDYSHGRGHGDCHNDCHGRCHGHCHGHGQGHSGDCKCRHCRPDYLAGSKYDSHVEKDETNRRLNYLALDEQKRGGRGGHGGHGGACCDKEPHKKHQLTKRDPIVIEPKSFKEYKPCNYENGRYYSGGDDCDYARPGNYCDDDFDFYGDDDFCDDDCYKS